MNFLHPVFRALDVTEAVNQFFEASASLRLGKILHELTQHSKSDKYDHWRGGNNHDFHQMDFPESYSKTRNRVLQKYPPYQMVILYAQNQRAEASQVHRAEAGELFL